MIRARLSRDDGFAVVMTVVVLLVGLLLSTALVMQAVATQDVVRRDGASKRAIQAARAGSNSAAWLMSALAKTTDSGDPGKVCATNAGGSVSYSGVAADGWCPPVTQQLGAGESVTYRVSAPFQSAPSQTSRDVVAVGTAPAAYGAGVTRRVRQRITSSGPPDVFSQYAVVSLDDLYLSNSAQIATQQVGGNARSNGNIVMSNSAEIWGDGTPGPGKTVTTSNSATVHGSTTPAPTPISLPTPVPPALPADNGNIDAYFAANCAWGKPGCSFSTWSNRVLNVTMSDSITLTGNTFVLCQLQMSNSGKLVFKPAIATQPVRIYIDKPSSCGGITDSLLLSNNTDLSTTSTYPLQIYIVGATSPTRVMLSNASSAAWTVYAPQSTVSLSNSVKVVGGIAAKSIQFSNSAEVDTPPAGSGGLQIGGPSTYARGDFVECTSTAPSSDPAGGC